MSLLEIRNLHVHFQARSAGWRKNRTLVRAVDGVNFDLDRGEILSVVGESGCGKSTLAMAVAGLERPASGSIAFDGVDATGLEGAALKAFRRRIQVVFQDPYESLPPSMTVAQIVAEPLIVHGLAPDAGERDRRVRRALEDAGLTPVDAVWHRRPHALSGGQRQRVVIAAALVLEPDVLLADEPVSMLDVSIRAGILNLLDGLRRTRCIAVLLITHDLAAAAHLSDRVAVMYLGRFVEVGPTRAVLERPIHPYTQALISVSPVPDPRRRQAWTVLSGDAPDASAIPSGCRFHPRCPMAEARCAQEEPAWVGDEHRAACLLQAISRP